MTRLLPRTPRRAAAAALAALAALAVLAAPGAALAVSTTYSFDTDAQGWVANSGTLSNDKAPTYVPVSGTTGGYIAYTDDSGAMFALGYLHSPLLNADYSAAYGGTLSIDLQTTKPWDGTNDYDPYIVITSPNGTVRCTFATAAVPPDGSFHTLTATLDEAVNPSCTWLAGASPVSAATFRAILGHVAMLTVGADADVAADDTVSLDNVRLIGPPDTTIVSSTPPLIPTSSTTIAFDSTPDAGTSFECQLDGAAFVPCTSPDTLTALADGAHTFAVRAILSGVADPTPATVSFAVDTRPLATTSPPIAPPNPFPPVVKPALKNVSLSGGTLLFTSTTPGTLGLTISRAVAGRRKKGHSCSTKLHHGTRCSVYRTVFHATRSVLAGAGRFTFGRSALKKGTYRATLTLTLNGSKPAASVSRTFAVR
jgi:hypothetical protein